MLLKKKEISFEKIINELPRSKKRVAEVLRKKENNQCAKEDEKKVICCV